MEEKIIDIKRRMHIIKIGQEKHSDKECDHIEADNLLCELLELLGHQDIVDEFYELDLWYA